MNTGTAYPHLTTDTNGHVRVGQSRYKVLHLAGEHYHWGWSAEELLRQHPDLRPEEVYSSLAWFYDHFDELREQLIAPSAAPASNLSREQLIARSLKGS